MNKYYNDTTNSNKGGGIGFVGALTLLFIALKLIPGNEVNNWPWLWVLSPIWIILLLLVAGLIIGIIMYAIVEYFKNKKTKD